MAKNDTVLIDGIVDSIISDRGGSDDRGDVFEYFACQQILKQMDLTEDELISGSVDGRDDGGIDGFYIFVNGHLLGDIDTFQWPRAGAEIRVHIITCKHHETFKQAPLDTLSATLTELLDFSIGASDFIGNYSEDIVRARETLKLAYRKLSPRLREFYVRVTYASRGDTSAVGDSVSARGSQISNSIKESFSDSEVEFYFTGSKELVELSRQTPTFDLELEFEQTISHGDGYIVLSKLRNYNDFVNNQGQLRSYLFDSNVRGFMGLNRVNEDIQSTLCDSESPDFWWLNNGITVIATSASIIGKIIKLDGVQIVNGLQTTESIHRYFTSDASIEDNRTVLVKIIVTEEKQLHDEIVKATNNQTLVELAALHATDEVQRNIEDVLYSKGFYYERRPNIHQNHGISKSELITPLNMARAHVAVVLKNPKAAAKLRSKFMRNELTYEQVFSVDHPLQLWPILADLLQHINSTVESMRHSQKNSSYNRFMKRAYSLSAFIAMSRKHGTFMYSLSDVLEGESTGWDSDDLLTCVQLARSHNKSDYSSIQMAATAAANKWGIADLEKWEKFGIKQLRTSDAYQHSGASIDQIPDVMKFVDLVDDILPDQPWKPGAQKRVLRKLGCSNRQYYEAVQMLIENGQRYKQKDGVCFDADGNVALIDEDRVNPDTLELKFLTEPS